MKFLQGFFKIPGNISNFHKIYPQVSLNLLQFFVNIFWKLPLKFFFIVSSEVILIFLNSYEVFIKLFKFFYFSGILEIFLKVQNFQSNFKDFSKYFPQFFKINTEFFILEVFLEIFWNSSHKCLNYFSKTSENFWNEFRNFPILLVLLKIFQNMSVFYEIILKVSRINLEIFLIFFENFQNNSQKFRWYFSKLAEMFLVVSQNFSRNFCSFPEKFSKFSKILLEIFQDVFFLEIFRNISRNFSKFFSRFFEMVIRIFRYYS